MVHKKIDVIGKLILFPIKAAKAELCLSIMSILPTLSGGKKAVKSDNLFLNYPLADKKDLNSNVFDENYPITSNPTHSSRNLCKVTNWICPIF
ncbi:MAG: hypothetical protein ACI8P3_004360 [Saprospiraceae bacterium]|jgi:hypothetical protein